MFFPDKAVKEGDKRALPDQDEILAKAPIVEFEITKGRKIPARLVTVPIRSLRLSPTNPRIRHKLRSSDETEIEEWLWREEGTRTLYAEIRYSGGLSEKPIIDSEFFVIEGNRRMVCLRRLDDETKNGELPEFLEDAFERVQCFMLPAGVPPKDVDLLLARVHVSGKSEWAPLNQAEQIFDMMSKHSMPTTEVASALSISSQRISVMFDAFRATLDYGDRFPDEESKWIHKFSYFYELYRRRQLRAWAKEGKNLALFMDLISGDKPKLWKGSQVRDLGDIIVDKNAFGTLLASGFDQAFAVLKTKQPKGDRYTKALEEASALLLELTREQVRVKDRGKLRMLEDIRERADYILLKNRQRRAHFAKVGIKSNPAIEKKFYAHVKDMVDRLNDVPREELVQAGTDPMKLEDLQKLRDTVDEVLRNVAAIKQR
jgi:hypothetical protein